MMIKDPIYNYVHVNSIEQDIIDSPIFQRLRYINQLAVAYLVYPGAIHSRYEHSLGTMHLAKKFFEYSDREYDEELVIAALLHDVGHGPFSHVSEQAFKEYGIDHEENSVKIIKEGLASTIEKYGLSPRKVANYVTGKGKGVIITGTIGVDRIDYLMRDSFHTGAAHGKVDYEYILENLNFKRDKLNLGQKGLEAAEGLVAARYMMFTVLYQHKTVMIASEMLKYGMQVANERGELMPEEIMKMSDYELMLALKDINIVKNVFTRNLYKSAFIARYYQLPGSFVSALNDMSLVEDLKEDIMNKFGLDYHEVIVINSKSSYKPISLLINDISKDLSEVSPLVGAIKEGSNLKRIFLVAVPEKYRKSVGKYVKNYVFSS